MPADTWILLAIFGGSVVLFATNWIRLEVTSLGLITTLAVSGLITPTEALSGFSSPATLTVAAMFVLSTGLARSGAVDLIATRLMRISGGGPRSLLLTLLIPTAIFSAFMNNTPVVALFIPVALSLGKRFDCSPSKLLLPLSFLAMLGGSCTLIGTSTNVLVNSIDLERGGAGFSLFEFAPLGLILVAVGFLYVLAFAPKFLPARVTLGPMLDAANPDHFLTEVRVVKGSRWIGRPLSDALVGSDELRVLELVRDEQAVLSPPPSTPLAEGDLLLVESSARAVHGLLDKREVEPGTAIADDEGVPLGRVPMHVAEAIVTPNSSFRGRRIRAIGLNRKYGVSVLALRRLGRHHQYKLRNMRVQSGDVLLIQGPVERMNVVQEHGDVLLVKGIDESLTMPRRAPIAVLILALVVAIAGFEIMPIAIAALGGCGLMFLTRCLAVEDAKRSLDWGVLLLLAATLPLGLATEKSGLAGEAAMALLGFVEGYGPVALVGAVYLMTSGLSSVLSNNATAVLLAPIAYQLAEQAGIDPRPLVAAIAFGASASLFTPIGYQTNTMVFGPGGYRFGDYVRFGLPLNVLLAIVAAWLIPLFWPVG